MTNEEKLKEDIQKEWDNLKRFPTTGQELNEYVIKCVTSEAAREYWQKQQAPDMDGIRKEFYSRLGAGDFQNETDILDVDKAWDFFAPMIKGSGSVVAVELLDKMIESEKYGAEEYIQDLGNSEGAERCFAKIEILEELKELFKQTKKG